MATQLRRDHLREASRKGAIAVIEQSSRALKYLDKHLYAAHLVECVLKIKQFRAFATLRKDAKLRAVVTLAGIILWLR